MSTNENGTLDDKALAAVLAARDGPAGTETLEPEARALAPAWENLADELRHALRMGPGGLTDAQREVILEAAAAPAAVVSPPARRARPGMARGWWWLAAAASVVLGVAVTSKHFAPAPAESGAQAKSGSPGEGTLPAVDSMRVRVLPGEAAGSRYALHSHAGKLARQVPVAPRGDWSAVGPGGGFQPAAMANVAEVVLPPMPGELPPLPEFFASHGKNGRMVSAEEMINGFAYSYPEPPAGEPLGVVVESGPCPWIPGNLLVRIGLKATGDKHLEHGPRDLVASDVRLVVEFNPLHVAAFRMVGQEGSGAARDPEKPVVQGADLRSGQAVTMIYEIVPAGASSPAGKEWTNTTAAASGADGDLLLARAVFRVPGRSGLRECQVVLQDRDGTGTGGSEDFRFASAVAAWAMLRDGAPGLQHYRKSDALAIAKSAVGADPDGRRSKFVQLLGQSAGR